MKAEWIHELMSDLRALKLQNVSCIYPHAKLGDSWNIDPVSSMTAAILDGALSLPGITKLGKTRLFPLRDVGVVVEVQFFKAVRNVTAEQVAVDIARQHENSQHRFDALHDSLTGCRNRKSFEKDLARAIHDVAAAKMPEESLGERSGAALTLATVDIDHFKRINDGRGHDYGDIVLRAFAWHLDEACRRAAVKYGNCAFSLYRLGGEEFNILVVGALAENEVLAWLDEIRTAIQNSPIPSNAQVETFARDAGVGIPVPAERDRKLTASIGVARLAGSISTDLSSMAGEVKIKADKALYAAKNAGRNRSIYFPEIMKRFGRLIEDDAAAAVVVIDIGSDVGVEPGREFFVIPTRYSGDEEYAVDDGRSRKVLGKIPRMQIAKLVAFAVEAEVSFCYVTERREGVNLVPGSLLESIPLGLFGGLPAPHRAGLNDDGVGSKATVISEFKSLNAPGSTLVTLRLEGLRTVEKEQGQVRGNEILAQISSVMSVQQHGVVKAQHAELGCFSTVLNIEEDSLDAYLSELAISARNVCGNLVKFKIGAFERSLIKSGEGLISILSEEYAYDYSLIAAASAPVNGVARFDLSAPGRVLSRLNSEDLSDEVVADYLKFRRIGLNDASIQNSYGIALFKKRMFAESVAPFKVAYELEDGSIFRSNCGLAQFHSGRYGEAYDNFRTADEGIKGRGLNDNLRGVYAVSAFYSHRSAGVPGADTVTELFEIAALQAELSFVQADRLKDERDEWDEYNAR